MRERHTLPHLHSFLPFPPTTTVIEHSKVVKEIMSKPASVRSSVRSSQAQGKPEAATLPPVEGSTPANAQEKAESTRSSKRGSVKSTGTSKASITSSQALSKLQDLEALLLAERRAREEAEETLISLQRERIGREAERQKSEQAQKQLSDVMNALTRVVSNPSDPVYRKKLQAILQGQKVSTDSVSSGQRIAPAPPPQLNATTASDSQKKSAGVTLNAASGLPPLPAGPMAVKPKPQPAPQKETDSDRSSVRARLAKEKGDVSFLDSLGQYERDKEKERKKAKLLARSGGQLPA